MSVHTGPQQRAHWHDAYDSQMELWRWYRTELGESWLARHYRDNSENLMEESRMMLRSLYMGELGRLLDCDPIYVSEEMCEVVEHARDSFALEPLLETDLVTPRGFLYWAKPFEVADRLDHPMLLHGMSWTRIFSFKDPATAERWRKRSEQHEMDHGLIVNGQDKSRQGRSTMHAVEAEEELVADGGQVDGIAVTLYAERDDYLRVIGLREAYRRDTGRDVPSHAMPKLLPMHMTPWYFGMSYDGNEVDENEVPTGAEWWWRLCQTTFRLMQQRIATTHLLRPHRAQRREAKAAGLHYEPEVVVVRLRRESAPTYYPSGEEANYSHRFIVGGHWRNQWYPSQRVHRQIWISPYVKGPEDKPLIVRPRRVYQWER